MSPVRTIADLLADGADRFRTAPAVVGSGGTVNYQELAEKAARLAAVLAGHLPQPGQFRRVALHVTSKTALCLGVYGTAGHGWSAMVCSEEMTAEQLQRLLVGYQPAGLILDEGTVAKAGTALAGYGGAVFTLSASGAAACMNGASGAVRADARPTQPGPDDEALVLFTSGTTGDKKAVPISHRNLIETSLMINRFMGLDRPVAELVTVPLSHAFGLRRIICVHLVGGAVVTEDGPFNPARTLKALRDRPCAALSAVPGALTVMRAAFGQVLKDVGTRIEFMELGSAPLSAQGKTALCELFPKAQISMHYGLTEASKVTFLHFLRDAHKLHTVGRPSPGVTVKVADESGREVPRGGVGEIWARGFNVAAGYLMDDRLTRERFVDGWFRTGDLARADEEGYLELMGRTDEMINVGGKKLYPLEIEQRLKDAFPEIDCAVGAETSEHLGARPVLYYSHATPVGPELFREMVAWLAASVESYKIPARAVAVPAIPKTGNGKIIRRGLADDRKAFLS